MSSSVFYVRLHCWTDGEAPWLPASPVDVTQFVRSVQWTDSIGPPWSAISVAMAIPFRHIRDVLPGRRVSNGIWNPTANEHSTSSAEVDSTAYGFVPETGFWVEVGHNPAPDNKPVALAFGRVHNIESGYSPNQSSGLRDSQGVVLHAESILAVLGRSRIVLAAKEGVWGEEGFVYNIEDWNPSLTTILKSWEEPYVGDCLSKLLAGVCKIVLPPSLGGGTIGDNLPVVYHNKGAIARCPLREQQLPFVPGRINLMNIGGSLFPNQTVLSFLGSMFMGDPAAIEFFCSLEYPTQNRKPREVTKLGAALGGAQPVVVYRLKPWILNAVTKDTVVRNNAVPLGTAAIKLPQETACKKANIAQEGVYTVPSGAPPIQWYDWNEEDVVSVRWAHNDSDRCNIAWGKPSVDGSAPMQTYGLLGSPIVTNKAQIVRHGLRPYELHWPFFDKGYDTFTGDSPVLKGEGKIGGAIVDGIKAVSRAFSAAADALAGGASMINYRNAIGELAWLYAGEGQRFVSGTFTGRFVPWAKQGHWARVRFGGSTLTCYIEAITHDISVDASSGLHEVGTHVRFSRGTLRYTEKPEYQFIVNTAQLNIDGKLAGLIADQVETDLNRHDLALQKLAVSQAKPLVNKVATLLLPPKKAILRVTPGMLRKGFPVEFIVVHYTNGTTVEAMLREFNKPRKSTNEKTGKQSVYNTSTHYSVDVNGSVLQWVDPNEYFTNHTATAAKGTTINPRSIGIDFLKLPGQAVTPKQLLAGQLLIQHLFKKFPSVQRGVSTDRAPLVFNAKTKKYAATANAQPYDYNKLKQNMWGVIRHRDVYPTRCPDNVPMEKLVVPPPDGYELKIQKMSDDEYKKILATMAEAGYDPDDATALAFNEEAALAEVTA